MYSRCAGQPQCRYGIDCHRKNSQHWADFDHPASHGFLQPSAYQTSGELFQPVSKRARSGSSSAQPETINIGDTTDEDNEDNEIDVFPLPTTDTLASTAATASTSTTTSAAIDDITSTTSVSFTTPASTAISIAAEPVPLGIPSRYTNPATLLRTLRPGAPPQPVKISLPQPWRGDATLLACIFGGALRSSSPVCKIAGFDFDDTLSERKAADGKDKWRSTFWNHRFARSPAMLRALHARGFAIVVCTNESVGHLKNVQPLQSQLAPKCTRVANWAADIGVPILALVATNKKEGTSAAGHTLHKQPLSTKGNAGMWHVAEELLGVAPGDGSGGESFFVGDAAGRDGDHGDDDRRLAASAGVRFFTEREFFERDPLQLVTSAV